MKIAGGLLSQMPILDICLIYLDIKIIIVTRKYNQESVAGSVIQATGMVEFEDGLRTESSLQAAGTLVVAAPSPGSILHHPGCVGWSWGRYGCPKDPCQTEF